MRPLPVLRELTDLLPHDAWLTTLSLDQKGVELTGQAAAASALIPLLENSSRLERVEFASPVTRGRDKEQFRIRAAWEAGGAHAWPGRRRRRRARRHRPPAGVGSRSRRRRRSPRTARRRPRHRPAAPRGAGGAGQIAPAPCRRPRAQIGSSRRGASACRDRRRVRSVVSWGGWTVRRRSPTRPSATAPTAELVPSRSQVLARRLDLVAPQGRIVKELETANADIERVSARFLTEAAPAVAASELQKLTKEMAAQAATEIRSERILPPVERGELLEIPVEIAVSGEIRQLVDLLRRLEGSQKFLTVQDLRVRVVNVSQPKELLATLTVSGFILPGKSKQRDAQKLLIVNALLLADRRWQRGLHRASAAWRPMPMPSGGARRPRRRPPRRRPRPTTRRRPAGAYATVAARNLFSPTRTEAPPTAAAGAPPRRP